MTRATTVRSIFHPLRPALAIASAVVLALLLGVQPAAASSHREAPFVTEHPKVDAADFYMFRSYEPGREGYVTLFADYLPLQDPYGGPNYFFLDPDAEYVIHVDNTGDGIEDVSFVFLFDNRLKGQALQVGDKTVPIPLIQSGVIQSTATINQSEVFQVLKVDGELGGVDRSGGSVGAAGKAPDENRVVWGEDGIVHAPNHLDAAQPLVNLRTGGALFARPLDNIGQKTFPNYAGYANIHIRDVGIPDCGDGRLFVGQRRDPFVVALGGTFDLLNLDPVGPRDSQHNDLEDKNVTTLALEVPIACLTGDSGSGVIGGWTTARLPRSAHAVEHPELRAAGSRRRRLDAGVAPRQPTGQRGGHRPAGQGPVQRLAPGRRRGARHLRHQPDAAGAHRAAVLRRRRQGAEQLPPPGPGGRLRHRHRRSQPAERRQAARDAAPQHRHPADAEGAAGQSGSARSATTPASPTGAGRATTWSTSSCVSPWASSATPSRESSAAVRPTPRRGRCPTPTAPWSPRRGSRRSSPTPRRRCPARRSRRCRRTWAATHPGRRSPRRPPAAVYPFFTPLGNGGFSDDETTGFGAGLASAGLA